MDIEGVRDRQTWIMRGCREASIDTWCDSVRDHALIPSVLTFSAAVTPDPSVVRGCSDTIVASIELPAEICAQREAAWGPADQHDGPLMA